MSLLISCRIPPPASSLRGYLSHGAFNRCPLVQDNGWTPRSPCWEMIKSFSVPASLNIWQNPDPVFALCHCRPDSHTYGNHLCRQNRSTQNPVGFTKLRLHKLPIHVGRGWQLQLFYWSVYQIIAFPVHDIFHTQSSPTSLPVCGLF